MEEALKIIEWFEADMPLPINKEDWDYYSEKINMYLSALKYVQRYG